MAERKGNTVDMTERRERTRQLPNGRSIEESGYMLAMFGMHRDSDPLEESNYGVAMRRLLEAAGMQWDEIDDLGWPTGERDGDRDAVTVGHFGHWAVGWIDELLIRDDRFDLIDLADEMRTYIDEQYPILDEEDFSRREWASNHPDDGYCYSDDDDCPCGMVHV